MNKLFLIVTIVLFSFASAFASASIISGTTQNVTFNSTPDGATILIDGVASCSTPCTVRLPKTHSTQMISFKKDGYKTMSIPMTTEYNGVALLNIFWDFSTTDMITGAAFEYKPNNYFMEMQAETKTTIK